MNLIKLLIVACFFLSITCLIFHKNLPYNDASIQTLLTNDKKISQRDHNHSLPLEKTNKDDRFVDYLEKGDFNSAFFLAIKTSNRHVRKKRLRLLFIKWVRIEPDNHVIPFVYGLNSEYKKKHLYTHIFDAWANWNIKEFNSWLTGQEANIDFDSAIKSLINKDKTGSLDFPIKMLWATKISDIEKRGNNIKKVLKGWDNYNLEEVITWATKDSFNQHYLSYLFKEIAEKNLGESIIALDILANKNDTLANESLFTIFNAKTELSSSEEINHILASTPFLSSETLKKQIYELFLPSLLIDDIQQVAQVLDSMTDESNRALLQRRILSEWANIDPQAAIDYINVLPMNENNSDIINDVISNWKDGDVFSADEWLSSLSHKNENIDQGASSLAVAASIDKKTIHISVKWLNQIKDPTIRKNAVLDVVSWWSNYDKNSAIDYLNSSNIKF